MKLLIKGGRVVDPSQDLDGPSDVLVEDGRIARVGKRLQAKGAEIFDAKGLVVCPGFIDMHVHFREPGQEWKETIETGLASAAAGGFTAVACMPNTAPPNDNRAITEMMIKRAEEVGGTRLMPIGCVSKQQRGEELAEMGEMFEAGAVAFSDDGHPVRSSLLMRKALDYSRVFDAPIIDHCEDRELVDGGVVNEGDVSVRLGLRGWPPVAEDILVQRDLLLAEYTGGHVHIAHMSTGRAAEFVKVAKKRRVRATCEVTPHHVALTEDAVAEYDTDAKMNPPLRSLADVKALHRALRDGTVDAIATDHAPHHADEKCVEFSCAPFGVVGLETAVPVCIDALVFGGVIDLGRLVELFTIGPARVLKRDLGTLRPGAAGDLTIVDLERSTTIEAERFRSKSRNSPFVGRTYRGTPVATIVAGRVVFDARVEEGAK